MAYVLNCLCVLMCLQVVLCQIEKCKTFIGDVGSCVPIADCEPLLKVLPQARVNPMVRKVMQESHCGFNGKKPKVCCPIRPKTIQPPLTTVQAPITTAQHPLTTIQPPITTLQPPITTLQPPITTLQPPITTIQPPITTVQPPPTTTLTSQPPNIPVTSAASSDYITAFPEPPVCGQSNATFGRIVDGVDATLGDFPWIAVLGYEGRRGQPMGWLCGGSLISSRHVLTAAHCIHNHEDDLYVVRLGELDLEKTDDGANPIDVLIKTKIKHEEYSPTSYANDIGILVLERDVAFTDLIHPICIPTDSNLRATDFVDYRPIVAGWGQIAYRGPKASHLQLLQLPVVSNEYCEQAYSLYKTLIKIDNRVLCAGFKSGGKDACQGDSGGPLKQPIWNPKIFKSYVYQIGVVSFGRRCADAGFPGVYTRLTSFVPWLQKVVLGISSS